ncbi:MAG TPA: IS481 family transposase [Acidimicrobiales bacterium]
MEMATYLVAAVMMEGHSVRKVAADHGVSKTWLYELVARYQAEGEAGLVPRSRRPHRSPTKVADLYEDEIVRLRKELGEAGYDAGAETIQVHLRRAHRRAKVPSTSTIWRVLKARGFVTPEPHKRPRSSWVRFCADLPNECWQMDITHVYLASGREVEILNIIDDHSRLCVATRVLPVYKAIDVVTTFHEAAARWGYPASVLSDNGAVFTAAPRHGVCVMESELLSLGIAYKHSKPNHPQTCGKVERFHQTMKKHLEVSRRARGINVLQGRLDDFALYYNEVRPHRSLRRRTPQHAFTARRKARPARRPLELPPHCRVRQDKVNGGNVTLRYKSDLLHIGVGRAHNGRSVLLLVKDLDVRILTLEGELIRQLTIDPSRNYQPQRV